jgi:hypothetical protein
MRIGLNLAKNLFEVYAVDGNEAFLFRKTLKRQQHLRSFVGWSPVSSAWKAAVVPITGVENLVS